jgi:hypothetical protein
MIALGVLVLLLEPARMALFRAGDDGTVARGADELLRYLSVVHSGLRRVAGKAEDLRFKHDQAVYGVEFLPVTWWPGSVAVPPSG